MVSHPNRIQCLLIFCSTYKGNPVYASRKHVVTITQGSIGMFIICYIMYLHTRCDCCIMGRSEFWNVWVQLVLGSQRCPIAHQFQGIEVVYWSLDVATSGSQFSSSNFSIPASVQRLNYSQRPLPSASIF